jgi:hypothetical protein
MDGINSALGTSKVKRQQQEIESLKHEKNELQQDIDGLTQTISRERSERQQETMQLKAEIHKIHSLFPKIKELLRIEKLCKYLGFSDELTKMILSMNPVGFKGKLYSSEYKRSFETDYSKAEIKPHSTEKEKLQLTIDGVSDTNWFRQKYKEFQETIRVKPKQKPEMGKSKGFKM